MGTIGGLPYPEPTDLVTNGDDAIKALATAIDKNPRSLAASLVAATPAAGWAAVGNGIRYIAVNGWVSLAGRMQRASGSNTLLATIPVAFAPIDNIWLPVNGGYVLLISSTGNISVDSGNVAGGATLQMALAFPQRAA